MKTLSFFLLLVFVVSSCQKEKETRTTVSGYVEERNGSRRIPNAKVYLVENIYGGSTAEIYHDSTIADANGFYHFDFDYGNGNYKILAEAPQYYTLHYSEGGPGNLRHHIEVGIKQHYNVKLVLYAWLKVRFINVSGARGVNINRFFGEVNGYSIFGEPDAVVIGKAKGNDTNTLFYGIYRWNQPGYEPEQHTIYCPGLDTTYTEITY